MKKNYIVIATFTYDGDGRRVKSVMGSETILFIGGHYEIKNPGSGQTITKYYFAGASRIAMRKYTIPQSMSVEYILGDHLGSTSITTDTAGAKVSEMRYKPWGEVRYSWTAGLSTTPAYKLNSYTFTGQYSYMDDPSTTGVTEGFGLLFYNARFYDPAIGRFISADSIVPGGVQGLDRYAYVNNSPINYTDPSGHKCVGEADECINEINGLGKPINGSGRSGYDFNATIGGSLSDPAWLSDLGKGMQDVFQRLTRECDWWNENCTVQITPERFVAIILQAELFLFDEKSKYAAELKLGTVHWFYDNCRANNGSCSGPTENALLTWLGGAMESAQRLIPSGYPYNWISSWGLATDIANAIISPPDPSWIEPNYSGRIHWGNASFYMEHYGHLPGDYIIGNDVDWPIGNPLYFIPYAEEKRICQPNYPCDKSDQ